MGFHIKVNSKHNDKGTQSSCPENKQIPYLVPQDYVKNLMWGRVRSILLDFYPHLKLAVLGDHR